MTTDNTGGQRRFVPLPPDVHRRPGERDQPALRARALQITRRDSMTATPLPDLTRGCSSTARTSAFQADDGSSILLTRSTKRRNFQAAKAPPSSRHLRPGLNGKVRMRWRDIDLLMSGPVQQPLHPNDLHRRSTCNMPLSWVTMSLVAQRIRSNAPSIVGVVRSVDCDNRYTAVERLKRFGVRRQAQNVRSV